MRCNFSGVIRNEARADIQGVPQHLTQFWKYDSLQHLLQQEIEFKLQKYLGNYFAIGS